MLVHADRRVFQVIAPLGAPLLVALLLLPLLPRLLQGDVLRAEIRARGVRSAAVTVVPCSDRHVGVGVNVVFGVVVMLIEVVCL